MKFKCSFFYFQSDEAYVCIYSTRENDVILFTHEGGVDIGDVDAKANKMVVDADRDGKVDAADVTKQLLAGLPDAKKK